MGQKRKKDSDFDVVDYEFLKTELKPPKRGKPTDTGKEITRFLTEMNRMLYSKPQKKEFQQKTHRSHEKKQPCMVKLVYGNNKETHKNFFSSYMVQRNKAEVEKKPELFNDVSNAISQIELAQYEEKMSDLHFKFIISPESQQVPLKNLVRAYIAYLEKATGYKFMWMAAEHYNTEHQHAHILINGIDKTGKKIRFNSNLIKETLRTTASTLCTQLVGQRSNDVIKLARSKLPAAYRYTILDDEIMSNAISFDGIKTVDDTEYESEIICRSEQMQQRLATLVEMGLAKKYAKNHPPIYFLEKKWANKLKSISRYNTFLTARTQLRYTTAGNLEQYTKDSGKITGIVTQRYIMDDEGIWNNAIVIENRKLGKAWYVPLRTKADEDVIGQAVECSIIENSNGKLRPYINIIGGIKNQHNKS